ncbi:MAG TPA: sodium-translocating pyrophosphatase, partial [Candidatus Marinimicrobia bacterium]|nr:sodium-translocating pyrophosphatase [Candidatus Neomarinimicrobiota bacterium]
MENNFLLVIGAAVLAMVYAFWKTGWINRQDEGTDKMKTIGANIAVGAMAFLKAEYRVLAVFVVAIAALLGFANAGREDTSSLIAVSFFVGALASG